MNINKSKYSNNAIGCEERGCWIVFWKILKEGERENIMCERCSSSNCKILFSEKLND